ncbi:uncharacterized protein LOC106636385 [Copidosoma floridanum]|uniref:uncharacterized protein LOC106636385 n=1 Tax=Copidosoma floridanum TaxID=29053 RepID=UPI0006C9BDF7|nr:uncharacterized protein LOC106636385 [Copidosoma floridanum]
MPVTTVEKFKGITSKFNERWNFPHVLGAIDSKHIRVKYPEHSGSQYFNYKGYYSIVLQALVEADYKFIVIDVGGYGQQRDGGTFRALDLCIILENGSLKIPNLDKLPDSNIVLP